MSDLGGSFKARPLEPSAMRSDDAGMYVAVGGRNVEGGAWDSRPGAGRPIGVPTGSPTRGPSDAFHRSPHASDIAVNNSSTAAATDEARMSRNYQSQPVDWRGSVRDHGRGDPNILKKLRSVSPSGHGNRTRGFSLDPENLDSDLPDADPYATPHNKRTAHKQDWLAGYTLQCCSHAPSCMDAFLFPWCMHGLQWGKLQQRRDQFSPVEIRRREWDVAERKRVAKLTALREQLDKKKEIDRARMEEEMAERDYQRQRNNNNNTNGGVDDGNNNADDDDNPHALYIVDGSHSMHRNSDGQYVPVTDESLAPQPYQESCGEKCEQMDIWCCVGSFFLDIITFPLLATPFGSATAQYHIRGRLRLRYNLVDAPGSKSEDEKYAEELNAKLDDLRAEEKKRLDEERDEDRKNFRRIWTSPDPDRTKEEIRRENVMREQDKRWQELGARHQDGDDGNNTTTATSGNNNYNQDNDPALDLDHRYQPRPSMSRPSTAQQQDRPSRGGSAQRQGDYNKAKQAQEQKLREQEDEGFCTTIGKSCDCCKDCELCGDDGRELMLVWCCSWCSVAQVQRELIMRDDYPSGFYSKPMKTRGGGEDGNEKMMSDPETNDKIQEATRAIKSFEQPRQRPAWVPPESGISGGDVPRSLGGPPSHSHVPPPPTPNEFRHQGLHAATSPPARTPMSQQQQRERSLYVGDGHPSTPNAQQQQQRRGGGGDRSASREDDLPTPTPLMVRAGIVHPGLAASSGNRRREDLPNAVQSP